MIRSIVFVLSVLIVISAVLSYWSVSNPAGSGSAKGVTGAATTRDPQARSGAPKSTGASGVNAAPTTAGAIVQTGAANAVNLETDFPIAAPLNAPESTVTRDLDVVSRIFDAWQSNFSREGNPVGENAEITAA